MDGLTILREARTAGLEVRVDGDRLIVLGPRSAAALAERLLGLKQEVIALLSSPGDADVAWRVEVMRRQIRPGPPLIIPFLVARRDFADAPGFCMSCGDPCGSGRRYRCGPCVHAAEIVVNEVWEGRQRPIAG
jgi:hypothetical protein